MAAFRVILFSSSSLVIDSVRAESAELALDKALNSIQINVGPVSYRAGVDDWWQEVAIQYPQDGFSPQKQVINSSYKLEKQPNHWNPVRVVKRELAALRGSARVIRTVSFEDARDVLETHATRIDNQIGLYTAVLETPYGEEGTDIRIRPCGELKAKAKGLQGSHYDELESALWFRGGYTWTLDYVSDRDEWVAVGEVPTRVLTHYGVKYLVEA